MVMEWLEIFCKENNISIGQSTYLFVLMHLPPSKELFELLEHIKKQKGGSK